MKRLDTNVVIRKFPPETHCKDLTKLCPYDYTNSTYLFLNLITIIKYFSEYDQANYGISLLLKY